jgi:glycosyltransferase involved in cell wall biosynthesis
MEYRPYYLAREWVRLGHQVQIVGSSQSHVRFQQPELAGLDRLDETIDGIQYTWLATPCYTGNGIGRIRNMAYFIGRLYLEGLLLAKSLNPDTVIASSTYPMDIWPAHRIAEICRAKLIFEVHDLWPLSPMELGGMSKWHPFIMLVQAAEDYAYRHADVVVSMLPNVREYMESRGLAPHKLHIVPNGIDTTEWQANGPDLQDKVRNVLSGLKGKGFSIVAMQARTFGQFAGTFLDAAKLMKGENVAFCVGGNGPDRKTCSIGRKAEDLHNVLVY